MIPPKFPLDEETRLRALRELDLLDTPRDERFDRLTRLAQAYFGMPMALITLIDAERQWFKSVQGLDGTETLRETSFCGHAILSDEILTVPDATEDQRFHDNPFVLEDPHVRFYAGAPIHAPGGERIGTLCIIDREPHPQGLVSEQVLYDLARCVDDLIAETKQQQVLAQLASRESYLHSLLAAMSDAVLTVDDDGQIRSANHAAADMLGYGDSAALQGQALANCLSGAVTEQMWHTERADRLLKRADGSQFPATVTISAMPGTEAHHLVLLRDITQQRAAEAEVARGLGLLQAISRAQHGFIAYNSGPEVFQQFLTELIEQTGSEFGLLARVEGGAMASLEALAMVDKRWSERSREYYRRQLEGPWRRQSSEGQLAACILSRQPWVGAATIPVNWGGVAQVAAHTPLLLRPTGNGGEVLGLLLLAGRAGGYDQAWLDFIEPAAAVLAQLISGLQQRAARRESEQRVRSTALELRGLLDTVPTGILKLDRQGRIRQANRAAQLLLLTPEERLLGSSYPELLAVAFRGECLRQLEHAVSTGLPNSGYTEADLWRHDGSPLPVEYLFTPMDGEGARELTLVMRDISERRAADRAKSEFVSTVSHELRTPLTSIRGSLGLVMSDKLGELPPRARHMLELANRNCERLTQLINDILDMEKMSAGSMHFTLVPISVDAAMEAAMAANEGYGLRQNVRIAIVERAADEIISADELRLQQVFSNLISNAIKYSPAESTVELSARASEQHIRFGVRDHGSGIPDSFRNRIFQRFSQADSSDMRAKGGTGLGLNIAQSIVEQLGGEIGFDTSSQGTEFYFRLPRQQLSKEPEALPAGAADILVCEDNPDVGQALTQVLAASGYSSHLARSAGMAERLLAASSYRLMLLDLGLPDRDGLDLLRQWRGQERGEPLPVIVVSGRDTPEAGLGQELNIAAWMQKPVDTQQLLKVLGRLLNQRSDVSVLHVEDDRDFAQVIGTMIGAHARYRHVSTLADARAALSGSAFDIVLLDLGLPDGDGASLLPLLAPETVLLLLSGHMPDEVTRRRAAATIPKGREHQAMILETIRQFIERERP